MSRYKPEPENVNEFCLCQSCFTKRVNLRDVKAIKYYYDEHECTDCGNRALYPIVNFAIFGLCPFSKRELPDGWVWINVSDS